MREPIISKNIRLRCPEHFQVGEGSIVDDFCYFSTRVKVGRYSHIANGCSVGGGRERSFELGDFSSLSAGVKVWCASDDFRHDLVTVIPAGFPEIKENMIIGDVLLGRCTAVGSNAVIMPDNVIPEGTVIGALSFVPARYAFAPWTVYAGVPIRPMGPRDRESVLRQLAAFERELAARAGSGPVA